MSKELPDWYKEVIKSGNYDIDDKIGEQALERKTIAQIEKECGIKREKKEVLCNTNTEVKEYL